MTKPEAFTMPASECPSCGEELDRASPFEGDGSAPRDGDLTVCAYCASALTFRCGAVFALTESEWSALDDEDRENVCRAQGVILQGCSLWRGRATSGGQT